MNQAKNGDRVKVHYTGKLVDNMVFDSSQNHAPLEFTIGTESVILGFEKGIIGMKTGDRKTITIQPEEAYGPRQKELVLNVKKSDFSENIIPAIGEHFQIGEQDDSNVDLIITDIDEDTVTFDANHPLAGRILIFDVELVAIG